MPDFTDIIRTMKTAAVEEVGKNSPVKFLFGKVKSVDPFLAEIDQRQILNEKYFTVGQRVKEYSLDLTIPGELWHGMRVGDELLLASMQGGDQLCIVDFLKRIEEDTRPAQVMTGEVLATDPIIRVNSYLTLTPSQLILSRNVTDYYIDENVSHKTEEETEHFHPVVDTFTGGGTSKPTDHRHSYTGRKKFLVHNGLAVGDKVLLLCDRMRQKWYVVDYIERVKEASYGEWV